MARFDRVLPPFLGRGILCEGNATISDPARNYLDDRVG